MKLAAPFLTALMFVMSLNAMAVDGKIACLNMEKVLFEYHRTKDAKITLYEASLKFVDQTAADLAEIKKLEKAEGELRAQSKDHFLSEEAKREHQRNADELVVKIFNTRREATGKAMKARQEVLQTYQEESQAVRKSLSEFLDSYAKEKGYTLIVDTSGHSRLRISSVVYHRPELDVTDSVITSINAGQADKIAKLDAKIEALRNQDKPTMDSLVKDLETMPPNIRKRLQELHAAGVLEVPEGEGPAQP